MKSNFEVTLGEFYNQCKPILNHNKMTPDIAIDVIKRHIKASKLMLEASKPANNHMSLIEYKRAANLMPLKYEIDQALLVIQGLKRNIPDLK